ncbi:hypothetical protein MFLAVUS_009634 [Mucor flavus]|uniref:Uncharacterized protein n=1 Tax=Mucor flavus TaxID=439312 RepID=A0ABP9ZAJ9_9FUNG
MHIYTIFSVTFVGILVTLTSAKTFDKEILVAGTHQVIEGGIKKRFSKSAQRSGSNFVARSSKDTISGSRMRLRAYDDDDSDVYGEDRPNYYDDDDVYGEDRPNYYDDDDVYGEDRPNYDDDDDVYGDDRPSRSGRYGRYNGRSPSSGKVKSRGQN